MCLFFWDISLWLFFINISRKQTQKCRLWLQIWEEGLDSPLKVGECFLKNWGWYHFGVTDECGVPGVLLKNVDKESRAEGVLSKLEFFFNPSWVSWDHLGHSDLFAGCREVEWKKTMVSFSSCLRRDADKCLACVYVCVTLMDLRCVCAVLRLALCGTATPECI